MKSNDPAVISFNHCRMNRIRKHIIGYGLLLLMLFSLSGITLHKMTCNMSGNSTISVIAKDECCDRQAPNSISEDCCDENSAFVQVTDFDRTLNQHQDVQPAVLMTLSSVAEMAMANIRSFQIPNKAPPITSVDRTILEIYLL